MTSKLTLSKPLVGKEIERSQELCYLVKTSIKDFQNEIYYSDANQLFKDEYVNQLLKIAGHLDELNYLLVNMLDPKNIYYRPLRTAMAAINGTSNVFIITAHYLNPRFEYKRFLNRNTFGLELSSVTRKVEFTMEIIERVKSGRLTSKNIPKPSLNFRSR